jgi:hypothetical protein
MPRETIAMNSAETSPAVDQEHADLQEVLRLVSEGKRVTDPELRRRITERADEARREMLQRHGLTNIAVDLIREGRDEE